MKSEELDQILEKSFRTEPGFHLSDDFTHKVVLAVERRDLWRTNLAEYLSILGIVTGLVLLVAGFYYYIDSKMMLKFFTFISANLIQVLLIGFILNFILFADRVLLRLLFNKWKRT